MSSTKPLVSNAADPKQVKRAERKEESLRDLELNDMRYLLNDKKGRRFLWRWLGNCGVYRGSFTGNSSTFFNEGQRDIGLRLLEEIHEASPEAYILMIKENKGESNV